MRTVSPNAPQFPARVLRDIKDFNDLKDLDSQRAPIRAESPKAPSPGQANNVSRHPGRTTSRMVRPTGAKAKRQSSRLLLFQSALPSTTDTQGAVPVELALGLALTGLSARLPRTVFLI